MWYKASAPGSLMLLGEYAVLYNHPAVVCAVNQRMTVILKPRSDNLITITSALGEYCSDSQTLKEDNQFRFVIATLRRYQNKLISGCDLTIESEFSHQIGFGSSAAVTVASLAVLNTWLSLNFSLLELAQEGRAIVQAVQGRGSGADIAASVFGGVIRYCQAPFEIETLVFNYPLVAVYSGYKTPTAIAIQIVKEFFNNKSQIFANIIEAIGHDAKQGIKFIKAQQWQELSKIMQCQQQQMVALQVNTPELAQLISEISSQENILAAKISGSGLGDCIVALGKANLDYQPSVTGAIVLPVTLDGRGVQCEQT